MLDISNKYLTVQNIKIFNLVDCGINDLFINDIGPNLSKMVCLEELGLCKYSKQQTTIFLSKDLRVP